MSDSAQPANRQKTPGPGDRGRSGAVVPERLSRGRRLAAYAIYCLIRLISATIRYQIEVHPKGLDPENHRFIFCTWHNRLPLCLPLYYKLQRLRREKRRMAAIVSASRDGAVVAAVLESFGVQPVRGSSSRRGGQALLELTSWADRGYNLAVTPDGPRGPCYSVQPGAITLAQLTGAMLVPASYWVSWKIRLKSWDRFQIPLPFSRVHATLGEPMTVPKDASEEQREEIRREFERRLRAITRD